MNKTPNKTEFLFKNKINMKIINSINQMQEEIIKEYKKTIKKCKILINKLINKPTKIIISTKMNIQKKKINKKIQLTITQ